MTPYDFDALDQLLRGEKEAGTDDGLFVQLMAAAPQPDETFIRSLEHQLTQRPQEKTIVGMPKMLRYIATIAAICVFAVGAVFAIESLLSQALDSDAGLQAVREEGGGTELNLSEVVEQFTVNIQWGYADTQRVSLGYVISIQDTQVYTNLDIINPVLTLADGRMIPLQLPGLHLMEHNQIVGRLEANVENIVLPDELNAQLSFQLAYAHEAHRTAVPLPLSGEWRKEWMLETSQVRFALNLPVKRGYTEPLDLVTEDAGIKLVLREFQAAPSLGRAVVCFTPPHHPEEEMWEWAAGDVTLEYNQERIIEGVGGRSLDGDGCSEIRFTEGLPLAPGRWTLTIRTLDGMRTRLPDGPEWAATVTAAGGIIYGTEGGVGSMSLPAGADETIGMREIIEGEWVFTFNAPQDSE